MRKGLVLSFLILFGYTKVFGQNAEIIETPSNSIWPQEIHFLENQSVNILIYYVEEDFSIHSEIIFKNESIEERYSLDNFAAINLKSRNSYQYIGGRGYDEEGEIVPKLVKIDEDFNVIWQEFLSIPGKTTYFENFEVTEEYIYVLCSVVEDNLSKVGLIMLDLEGQFISFQEFDFGLSSTRPQKIIEASGKIFITHSASTFFSGKVAISSFSLDGEFIDTYVSPTEYVETERPVNLVWDNTKLILQYQYIQEEDVNSSPFAHKVIFLDLELNNINEYTYLSNSQNKQDWIYKSMIDGVNQYFVGFSIDLSSNERSGLIYKQEDLNLIWQKRYFSPSLSNQEKFNGELIDMVSDSNGNLYCIGLILNQKKDLWFLRLNSEGCFDNIEDCQEINVKTENSVKKESCTTIFQIQNINQELLVKSEEEIQAYFLIGPSGEIIKSRKKLKQKSFVINTNLLSGVYYLQTINNLGSRCVTPVYIAN